MVNFYRCPLYLETTTSRSLSNSIYILSRINRVPSFIICIHRWGTIGTYGNMMQLLRIIECPQRGTLSIGGQEMTRKLQRTFMQYSP